MKSVFLVLLAVFGFGEQSSIDSRIIGGSTAADGEFPYQVSLKLNGVHFCGGSIIKPDCILTAAHCIVDIDMNMVTIMAGSNKLDDDVAHYNVGIATPHERYNPITIFNDIGIIHPSTSIILSPKVQLIEYQKRFSDASVSCVVSGWGYTSFQQINDTYSVSTRTNDLLYLNLTTITVRDCKHRWKDITRVTSKMICTFPVSGQGVCPGDSGGPLVHNGIQIGIVSFGIPCGLGQADVYTRVSQFTKWIKGNC